ncbi:MAG: Bro-N domain-containing protein [Azoarcus sp.]|nr:Bro-N domain-containing protein [Azoarcus sp.]
MIREIRHFHLFCGLVGGARGNVMPAPLDIPDSQAIIPTSPRTTGIGFSSPDQIRRTHRHNRKTAVFLRPQHGKSDGRAVRGAARLAGSESRSANPHGLAHPFSSGRARFNTSIRSIDMSHSQGASAPVIYNFNSHAVRVVLKDEQPWFIASDIAEALEYRNAPDMTRVLDDDEKGTQIVRTLGGDQEVTIISESGMYHAVLKSRKPAAKAFRRWVTGEVLPTIRKTGRYESSSLITPEQAGELATLIAERSPDGADRPYAWGRFNNHFRIARYRELPAHRFAEACAYIRQMPEKKNAPSVCAEPFNVEKAMLDSLCVPEASRPEVVERAIRQRTMEMTLKASEIIREHLVRRVASGAERGYPDRFLDVDTALSVIEQTTLDNALANEQQRAARQMEIFLDHAIAAAQKIKDGIWRNPEA